MPTTRENEDPECRIFAGQGHYLSRSSVVGKSDTLGMSYRELERETGIPIGTAHRWATPPKRAEPDQQDEG